jgi:hypothetical protein
MVVIGMEIGKYIWRYGFRWTERLNFIKRVINKVHRVICLPPPPPSKNPIEILSETGFSATLKFSTFKPHGQWSGYAHLSS